MPDLTLNCICAPSAALCTLTQIVASISTYRLAVGSIATNHTVILTTGVSGQSIGLINPSDGAHVFDITSWASNFDGITMTLSTAASLFQVPDPPFSEWQQFGAAVTFFIHYLCMDLVTGETIPKTVVGGLGSGDGEVKCEPSEGDIRDDCICAGTVGNTFFKSTPLGACGGCGCSSYDPFPKLNSEVIDIDSSGRICICASGGSGDYVYSVKSGVLPAGQQLNPTTGCIEGDSDGSSSGTAAVVFQVTDLGGSGVVGPTEVTVGGSCNTFGAGVTELTGPAWYVLMAGTGITIGGVNYTIDSVSVGPPNTMILRSSAGIQSPTSWSYTTTIPAPAVAPPLTAEVTCGFISNVCNKSTGTGYSNGGH